MNKAARNGWILLFTLFTCPAFFSLAGAELQTLESPWLSFGKEYPANDYKQVEAVLKRSDCKYLGGMSLNSFSSLRYGGDTIAANKFIAALSLCPNITVHVSFFRPPGGPPDCDWYLTQRAPSKELEIRINLASEKVKIENLYLPPVKADKSPD